MPSLPQVRPFMDLDPAFSRLRPLSWEEIHALSRDLARRLQDKGPFRGIVAVTRGGLVPAALLAQALDIRHIDTVCVAGYDDSTRRELEVLKAVPGDGAGLLVVDDLADTGRTTRAIRDMLPAAHYAALFAKPQGSPQLDTFVAEVEQEIWLVFPWEKAEA